MPTPKENYLKTIQREKSEFPIFLPNLLNNILEHKGSISKALADAKTAKEYEAYSSLQCQLKKIESLKELDADIKKLKSGKSK